MTRTLIIDADIVAYQAAAGAENVVNFGDETQDGGQWVVTADEGMARNSVQAMIDAWMTRLDADAYVLVLSDGANWRKDVLPTYKHNRDPFRKPIILPQVRAYMRDHLDAWQRPKLEGDDLLGILSSFHDRIPGEKVMVTLDKDLSCIPGYHYRPHRDFMDVFEVSVADADRFHLTQGIAGDPTDGYSGCPGMGMKSAAEFLEDPYELVPQSFTQHKGKFAGIERVKWVKAPVKSLWSAIVSLYVKEGLTEADALAQFQVARILRNSDYDFQRKEPILWQPTKLV